MVLGVVQYMLPCLLELHYTIVLVQTDSGSASKKDSWASLRKRGSYVALVVSVGIMLVCLRSMLLTCMFFHTWKENVVGFLIAALVAFLPLCSSTVVNAWVSCAFS